MMLAGIFYVLLVAWDIEDDGTYNFLLETPKGAEKQLLISYSSKTLLSIEPFTKFKIKAILDCFDAIALNKAPPAFEETYPFGVPRHEWLCNANKIEVLND